MAKQVIVQKVREAERDQVTDEYKDREGELLSGLVKRVDRNGAYIDLGGNAEGFIPRENLIPREAIRMHDRVKALLAEVKDEPRGPQLILTRTSPQFLIELFKIEVPEVGQGLIEILGAAEILVSEQRFLSRAMSPESIQLERVLVSEDHVCNQYQMNLLARELILFCGMTIQLNT